MSLDNIREIAIADVVGKHVALKKKGSNLLGLCPFHNEKTPSFTVTESKNIYKCFGCGEGGDGIKFYMKMFNLSFQEACKRLADEHNIQYDFTKVTEEDLKATQLRHETMLFFKVVAEWYQAQLTEHAEAREYAERRITPANLETFQVGFAPPGWNKLWEAMRAIGYKEEFLLTTGLFTQKDNGKVFDFFQNRIMFPIKTVTGDVVAFGGRVMDSSKPKYINSAESAIFEKGRLLYGLFEAVKHVKNAGHLIITEGYTDVTSMHEAGLANTAGLLGTSLTPDHVKLIKRYTTQVTLCGDNDPAGMKSIDRSAEILLRAGMRVQIATNIPQGQDPDSFFRNSKNKIQEETFLLWKAQSLFSGNEVNPIRMSDNMREIARWLNMIDEVERNGMIEYLTREYKSMGVSKKNLAAAIAQDTSTASRDDRQVERDESNLPDYVDKKEFRKYGFYVSQGLNGDMFARNQYIFDKDGRMSNFILEPLFHVKSEIESRKIFRAVNKYGEAHVIEMDLESMNSLQRFRKTVEEKGNYLFEGNDRHLMHLKRMWYDQTNYCKRVENLGWQHDGFWAWANGITTNDDIYLPCDENGIIEHEKNHYFIAPYSVLYRNKATMFVSERRFMYISNKVGMKEWATLFIRVYGHQGMISIAFWLTSLFSDFIFQRLNNLPILNIYGQKGTGKNEQAMSLTALFGKIQDPLQIHNTTKAGLAAHMEEFTNALFWIDEYKNAIPIELIEGLKAIYNRMGRTRKSMREGQGKEASTVRSMGIITGQEMLTADIALFSRVICLMYYKTEFTKEEEEQLEELQKVQSKGLSHITAKIVRLRQLVIDNYMHMFNSVGKDMGDFLNTTQTDGRLLRNMTTVLATFKCLEPALDLPFSYAELLDESVKNLLRQNELIYNSNELATFWGIVEYLIERGELKEKQNYKIKATSYLKVMDKKGAKNLEFKPDKEVMLLKWAGIYQLYSETARRSGQHPLPESTLTHYLTTSSYYLGKVKTVNFDGIRNSAYAFDYLEIKLNLKRIIDGEKDYESDDTDRPDRIVETEELNYPQPKQGRLEV